MKYMGSKRRIAPQILPIMLAAADSREIEIWVEPFVGGANSIDKVPARFTRKGFDANPHTIAALIGIRDHLAEFPASYSEEDYRKVQYKHGPHPLHSLARFLVSFSGRFDEGFARGDSSTGVPRDYWKEGLRNVAKQAPLLAGVELEVADYHTLDFTGALVYCDPPYAGTKGYRKGLVPEMNYPQFWDWCRKQASQGCEVFVSEYSAPPDFKVVWSAEVSNTVSRGGSLVATEKLYKLCT